MTSPPPPAGPDGALRFRIDQTGTTIAVLPARCKRGLHALNPSESRTVLKDGEVRISCPTCTADGDDHYWRLSTTAPAPERAELSDELYRDLVQRRPQPALALTGGGQHDQ